MLRCPCTSFHIAVMEKQCLSQLICKTAFLSSFKLLLKHFLLCVDNQVVLSVQLKARKNKVASLVTFAVPLVYRQDWDSESVSEQSP